MRTSLGEAIGEALDGRKAGPVSEQLGLSKNALWRWSTGTRPDAEHFDVLMAFLRVDLPTLGGFIAETQYRKWKGLPL